MLAKKNPIKQHWCYNDEELGLVKQYKYLGVGLLNLKGCVFLKCNLC
jgi:hypothetical protein